MQPKSVRFVEVTAAPDTACPLAQLRDNVLDLCHDFLAGSGTLDSGLDPAVHLDSRGVARCAPLDFLIIGSRHARSFAVCL